MNAKSLILAGILTFASLTIAYAKSYTLTLSSPAKAGNVELTAGEYSLEVKGETAVFTNVRTAKSYTAPVKIQSDTKKHDRTAVDTHNQDGTEKIQSIELGGSATTLAFVD